MLKCRSYIVFLNGDARHPSKFLQVHQLTPWIALPVVTPLEVVPWPGVMEVDRPRTVKLLYQMIHNCVAADVGFLLLLGLKPLSMPYWEALYDNEEPTISFFDWVHDTVEKIPVYIFRREE